MQKIRAVFLDIDSTLLSHRINAVPSSALKAIHLARRNGVMVFSATGRHILELDHLPLSDVEFDGHVLLDGALCMNERRHVYYSSPIVKSSLAFACEEAQKKGYCILINEMNRLYGTKMTEELKLEMADIHTPLPEIRDWHECMDQTVLQIIPVTDEENASVLMKALPDLRFTRWSPWSYDVVNKDVTKLSGIHNTLKNYGLPADAWMAVGDGENDEEMVREAPYGAAMGNGVERVKKCADFITSDIDEDGLYHAFEHFGLI